MKVFRAILYALPIAALLWLFIILGFLLCLEVLT